MYYVNMYIHDDSIYAHIYTNEVDARLDTNLIDNLSIDITDLNIQLAKQINYKFVLTSEFYLLLHRIKLLYKDIDSKYPDYTMSNITMQI